MPHYHALALFSGGLDSILATRLIMAQGLRVLGIHFVSPFFGKPQAVESWQRDYGVEVQAFAIGQAFVDMLARRPPHGIGKALNPCVDCKILMLRQARELLPRFGAQFLVSGEVLGQRPMSQREDTLNTIRNAAGVRDLLLRPLCAQHLPPTPMETSGLVDRQRLGAMHGRGRKAQLALAQSLGITRIPAQGGGCRLTERESARRYWPLLHLFPPRAEDFSLANIGRQLWHGRRWLVIARNNHDNARLEALRQPEDLLLRLTHLPGPLGLIRPHPGAEPWDADALRQAAATLAHFAPKARARGTAVSITVETAFHQTTVDVLPACRFDAPPSWEDVRTAKAAWMAEATTATASPPEGPLW